MKAARLTAVGMVAAATLWIASGHLLPHDSAQGEAAVRANEAKSQPPFRVAVTPAKVEPHKPDAHFVRPHRSGPQGHGGCAHRRRSHGIARQARSATSPLTRSSPCCRTTPRLAQVAQAKALVDQRRARARSQAFADYHRRAAESSISSVSKAQAKAAEAALGTAQAELERGLVRARLGLA